MVLRRRQPPNHLHRRPGTSAVTTYALRRRAATASSKVVADNGTTVYVYNAFGKLAAEYKDSGTPTPGTFYRTVDHLGSTRLVTDAAGTEVENTDYLPFGEEILVSSGDPRHNVAAYGSPGQLRHKFTGKERDSESGMDYFLARYYSGPMGRFLSVDPENAGAVNDIPQTWNAYAYTNNRPLVMVDEDGRAPNILGGSIIGGAIGLGVGIFKEVRRTGSIKNI